ncbi:unnamed protein product, partial [Prorocentrum cordatum]
MVPLPLVTVSLLSKDLVLEILRELDFYLIQILQGVALLHGLVETWEDERRAFWFLYVPSLVVAPMVDAYPAKYRPHFLQLYFVGMLCILVGWSAFELSKKSLHFFTYNVGDLATLSLFYLRQIYAATWQQDSFVLISCAMCTAHERVNLDVLGSGLSPEPQTVRVAPPRSYSFNAQTHTLSDWRRAPRRRRGPPRRDLGGPELGARGLLRGWGARRPPERRGGGGARAEARRRSRGG